jgi:phosphoketolase
VTGPAALSDADTQTLDRYWRAANYLAACQIYLMDNPLLTEPLRPEHIKPRLFGHWGTTPGLSFVWAHLNRAIVVHDADMMILVMDVIDRVPGLGLRAGVLRQQMTDARVRARAWTREHGEDIPEVANWTWGGATAAQPSPAADGPIAQ